MTVKFSSVITLSTSRTADPASAGIDRFVGLEHIEPENLHIRRWGLVVDGTTFTSTFKRGQVLFGKRRAYQRKVAVADFDGVCSLVEEATQSEPDKQWYSVSIDGLIKAAENLDKLGEPVINLSRKVLSLLTGGVIK